MKETNTEASGSHDTVVEDVDLGSGQPYKVVFTEFGVVAAGNGKRIIMDPGLGAVDGIMVGVVHKEGMTQEYSGLTGIPPAPETDNPVNAQGTVDELSSDLPKDDQ